MRVIGQTQEQSPEGETEAELAQVLVEQQVINVRFDLKKKKKEAING